MAFIIPLNRSNLVPSSFNNTYEFQFRGTAANFVGTEVAIHNINMYNNAFNIDSLAYANNTLQIVVPTGSTTTVLDILIPDGLYSYEDLSRFIQIKLREGGAYLINADGLEVHYVKLSSNAVYYGCQIDLHPVPTTLPSGWTRPSSGIYSGATSLPTTTRVMQMRITNAEFASIIGFRTGDYPSSSQTTAQTFISNTTPTIRPVSSYLVRCNLVTNPYTTPSDILGMFDNQGTQAGELISYRPNEHLWLPISDGSYTTIRITLVDQLERPIRIRDADINISLAIRSRRS